MLLSMGIAVVVIAVVLFLIVRETMPGRNSSPVNAPTATRRSPRVPISIPVAIHTFDDKFEGEGQNISHGGMLVHAEAPLKVAQPIELNFTLPDSGKVSIPAVVSYKKGEAIGMRFDPTHHERHSIEKWVNSSVKEQAEKTASSGQ